MNIRVICIGKLKETYWRDAAAEYGKRLGKYCRLSIEELKEARLPDQASPAEENAVKQAEGAQILRHVRQDQYVIALEIEGTPLTSPGLSDKLNTLSVEQKGEVVFIIGGSLGLSEDVSRRADYRLSFSGMTFPHQMMRVILLEQLYRSFKIIKGETYHK